MDTMQRYAWLAVLVCISAATLLAARTNFWTHKDAADFESGRLEGIALSSNGELSLAPELRQLLDAPVAYLCSVVVAPDGTVYAGGGGPGSRSAVVYRVDSSGRASQLAELEGLEVRALAVGPDGSVYAATNPEGKIYKLSASGEATEFYDPPARYVWAMVFDSQGNLYLGTGDRGEIYRVRPDGRGELFFSTEEAHVRSLVVDWQGNLVAGTEPGGLVLRISPRGEGFVLYQAPLAEITSLAIGADRAIYAVAVGSKSAVAAPAVPTGPSPAAGQPRATSPPSQAPSPERAAPPAGSTVTVTAPVVPAPGAIQGGTEAYRISAEGQARLMWKDSQRVGYAVVTGRDGVPVLATGNGARVYRLDSLVAYTVLASLPPNQALALATAVDGSLYVGTGNPGKLYKLGPGLSRQGVFESPVLDARRFSRWGRLFVEWEPRGGKLRVETRSGNLDRPERNWSAWEAVVLSADDGPVRSPAARFLQYRLTLEPGDRSPVVRQVKVAYRNQNVAPVIRKIELTPANYRFPPQTLTLTRSATITLPPLTGSQRASTTPSASSGGSSLTMQPAKGYVGVRWLAEDENGDDLVFRLEIRGEGEQSWKLLKDGLEEDHYSWDSTGFADGKYQIRLTASDSPDNEPAEALQDSMISPWLLIDNTPPEILELSAARRGNQLAIRFRAKDELSLIRRAEYAVDGGEWAGLVPVNGLSDGRELLYDVTVPDPGPSEHTLAIRVTDELDNVRVVKILVR